MPAIVVSTLVKRRLDAMQETKATSLERQVTLNEIVEDLLGEHDQAAKVEST